METLMEGQGAYLDAPDAVSADAAEGVLVACALHGPSGSYATLSRTDGESVSETWRSGPLDGLVDVRVGTATDGGIVVLAWCMPAPHRTLVEVFEPGTGRSWTLDRLSEPCPSPSPTGRGIRIVARRDETIVLVTLDADGSHRLSEVSDRGGRVFGPTCAADGQGGLLVAWEQEERPGCAILARTVDASGVGGHVLRLDDGDVTAHVPSAVSHPGGGVLVAWHAPAAFPEPQLLVKDVRLVLVKGQEVLHPQAGRAPHPGAEPAGEEQGFEFPVALPHADGHIDVLARGSHRYLRRVLGPAGWGDVRCLDEPGWGCRGPRIRAVRDRSGFAWTVTRERGHVVIRRLDPAEAADRGPVGFEPRRLSCTGPGGESGCVPPEPARDSDGLATWFGDIHQHSAVSDGTGAPHETYVRARDFYDDDIVALSDHESFLGKRTPAGEWAYLQDLARRFEEPARLATLVAYEWTGRMHPGPGHKVVYHDAPGAGLVSRDDPGADFGAELLRRVAAQGGIAIPHHVGWTGADEASHDEAVQPCFEIVSCHGAYERREDRVIGRRGPDRGPFVIELLRQGLRFGIVGGSDGHGLLFQHGISRKRDAHRTGLTAVLSRDLSREAVMDAIRARRVYATSGVRMWMRLWVDGHLMGSSVEVRSTCRVDAGVDAGGPLREATLVTASGEHRLPCEGSRATWSTEMATGGARFVYLRIVREDGECGWSSPVFLSPGP